MFQVIVALLVASHAMAGRQKYRLDAGEAGSDTLNLDDGETGTDTVNRTESAAAKGTVQGKDRLGVGVMAPQFASFPDDDVTAESVALLADVDFSSNIGPQLTDIGLTLGITAISTVNPVLGAIVGTFTNMLGLGGGGGDDLYAAIIEKVDAMMKESLSSFSSDLQDSHIQATLQTINYASAEAHWEIIAHDFLAGAPFMFNSSCWQKGDSPQCNAYHDGGFRALKYEFEYVALVQAGVVEMLRLGSSEMVCRAASLWSTMRRMSELLRKHFNHWRSKRGDHSKIRYGSVRESTNNNRRRRHPCYVEPSSRDNFLHFDLDTSINPHCYKHKSYVHRPGAGCTGPNTPNEFLKWDCTKAYIAKIDAQLKWHDDMAKSFDKFVNRMTQSDGPVFYCNVLDFHLAPQGAKSCDKGSTPSEAACEEAADQQAQIRGRAQGRQQLVAGSWGHVPYGCSLQSGGDWAAHFNRNPGGQQSSGYSLVCSGD